MNNYKVVAPNSKEVTIGLRYGSTNLTHGTVVPESEITNLFPEYFKLVTEPKQPRVITPPVTEPLITVVNEEKRKAGRPKGSFKKR
jgi:hypothetical protein